MSGSADSLGHDLYGIEGFAGCQKECPEVGASECEVCRGFGCQYFSKKLAVWSKNVDSVAGARPQAAFFVASNPVRCALVDLGEDASIFEAAVLYIKDADVLWRARVCDIKMFPVGRKAEAVWLHKISRDGARLVGFWVVSEHELAGLFFSDFLFCRGIGLQSIVRVRKPNRTVRADNNVVGRIEFFTFKLIHQRADGSVGLRERKSSGSVFGAHELSSIVEGVSVRVVAWVAKRGNSVFLGPLFKLIRGNVAEDKKTAARRYPLRTLQELHVRAQSLKRCGR